MTPPNFSPSEQEDLDAIVDDLNLLFDQNSIELDELRDLELQSGIVEEYLEDLRRGSEPEPALKDKLVTSASILTRAIFGHISPEIRIEGGIVDYKVHADDMPILLEIKPPFEAYRQDGETQRIRKRRLNWRDHRDQIERYREDNEYLIFTNLDEWVFFSKRDKDPIAELEFDEVYDDIQTIGGLRDFLERVEGRAVRGQLDEKFFEALESWRETLNNLDFEDTVSNREQTESIITFINKFIFVQTLDDHFVINFNWIEKRWKQVNRDWEHIGRQEVLERFLSDVNDWFYAYYDTELFHDGFLEYLSEDDDNIQEFYEVIPQILGLEDWQQTSNRKGITNFNYRQIDEDIFGKAYETSLASRREEEGIYYTGKRVTRFMVDQTVGETFDEYITEFRAAVEDEQFEEAKSVLKEMQSMKIVDPACGSGSFLIKVFDVIWERYQTIIEILEEIEYVQFEGSLDVPDEDWENAESVQELRDLVGYENDRELAANVILRHLYGNDKDADALAVAKVNIWLEIIKKVPDAFRYNNIPQGGGYTLPNLELNLQNGDALSGLPNEEAMERISDEHEDDIETLSNLRDEYLRDHTQESLADDLLDQQAELIESLDGVFESYLSSEGLSTEIFDETIPQHWPGGFWHAYFDAEGNRQDNPGFDFVIGNPPYINAIARNKYFEDCEMDFWDHRFPESASGAYDVYLLFLQQGLNLAREDGVVSFIVPNKHLAAPYAEGFRNFLLENEYEFVSLSDLSQLNVFDDPSVYPVVPVYRNGAPSEDITLQGHSPPTEAALGEDQYDHEHTYGYLDRLDENIWSFLLLTDDSVFWDIQSNCQNLTQVGTVQASGTASDSEAFTPAISEDDPSDTNKKFIKTGAIDPLLSLWEFEEIRHRGNDYEQPILDASHSVVSDLRQGQYNEEKLIFAKVASTIEVFPDIDGSYASLDTNLFYDGDKSMLYYGGILNSHVADFLYAGLFGALRMRGGDFQFQAPQLRLLSIPETGDDEVITQLEEVVSELLDRNQHRELFLHLWEDRAWELSNVERSLSTILSNDKEYIQEGESDLAWSDSVSFYPDTDRDELTDQYPEFTAEAEDSAGLTIYGIEGQSETEVFEAEFTNRELRDAVLASLEITVFRTRKNIDSVEDIFEKSEIPAVRQDTAENTSNVVEEIEDTFRSQATTDYSNCSIAASFGRIDNQISELWIKLNSLVLQLYSVSDRGASAVLDNVDVQEREKGSILSEFHDLSSEEDEDASG